MVLKGTRVLEKLIFKLGGKCVESLTSSCGFWKRSFLRDIGETWGLFQEIFRRVWQTDGKELTVIHQNYFTESNLWHLFIWIWSNFWGSHTEGRFCVEFAPCVVIVPFYFSNQQISTEGKIKKIIQKARIAYSEAS